MAPLGATPSCKLDAEEADYSIKPENTGPKLNTSEWPLLLKNYVSCHPCLL